MKTKTTLVLITALLSIQVQAAETQFLHFFLKSRTEAGFQKSDLKLIESAFGAMQSKNPVFSHLETFVDDSKNPVVNRSFFLANLMRVYPWINLAHMYAGQWELVSFWPDFSYGSSRISALDAVVRLELKPGADLRAHYSDLAELRQFFVKKYAVSLSISKEHIIKDDGTTANTDYFLSFIVPWQRGADPTVTQKYWLEKHGPLAASLIPTEIKKYVQDHTLVPQPLDVFDENYQGICFENVPSAQHVKDFRSKPGAWKASVTLASDEEVFSDHPSMMVFERISNRDL
jgi:hypothetical protein